MYSAKLSAVLGDCRADAAGATHPPRGGILYHGPRGTGMAGRTQRLSSASRFPVSTTATAASPAGTRQ